MRRWVLGLAVAGAALVGPAGASALGRPPILGPGGCYDPTQSNADYEAYGPTDVNVQAGNGRVTVNENAAGTITVFKYPDPSLFNLVKYFTLKRDANGQVEVQYPNEGSFAGIRYVTSDATRGFAWLRQWRSTQRYDSPDTAVPVTIYRSPPQLGLKVTDVDVAPPGFSRFVRDFWVQRAKGSPVRSASIVYFENFNPTASHIQRLPIDDWCMTQDSDGSATWDAPHQTLINSWSGTDRATGRPASAAVAFSFDGAPDAHQGGHCTYETPSLLGPADAYDQAPSHLGGSNSASGQTDGAIEQHLDFGAHGIADARMTIGAGATPAAALAAVEDGKSVYFVHDLIAEQADWTR